MKIGYPCINRSIGCRSDKTFRLKSYSEERLIETVDINLNCLEKILKYNVDNNILFFRISSDIVPFASHPICNFNWQFFFKSKFEIIGSFIKEKDIRISMHPDQFIVLNSKNNLVVERSIKELKYHSEIFDLMGLKNDAKIQLHIGGAYGDKNSSIKRFIDVYNDLDENIKSRLVIENDDHIFNLKDCLFLSKKTSIPILFDYLHHLTYNNKEDISYCLKSIEETWNNSDGIPMVDYSSQKIGGKPGNHALTLDGKDFEKFIEISKPYDFDIMLEIKDKEKSAVNALKFVENDSRFRNINIV